MNLESRYLYGPKWKSMLFVIIFFGSCAALFFYKTTTHDAASIHGLIELSPDNARIFFWAMAFFSTAFVFMGLAGIYFRITQKKFLAVTSQEVIIPPIGFRKREYRIDLKNPYSIEELKINGQVILKISYEGRSGSIVRSLFGNKEQYEEVKRVLVSNLSTAKSATGQQSGNSRSVFAKK